MSINCQSGFWKKDFTTAKKIALEKGTYVAFNSIGTGQFLCKGPAFLLEAVAKHVDDKVDAGFDLETLDITIAMEEAKDQLENREEEEEEEEEEGGKKQKKLKMKISTQLSSKLITRPLKGILPRRFSTTIIPQLSHIWRHPQPQPPKRAQLVTNIWITKNRSLVFVSFDCRKKNKTVIFFFLNY